MHPIHPSRHIVRQFSLQATHRHLFPPATDTLLSRHLLTVRTRCAGHLHHCPPLWKQSPLGSSSFFSSPSCLLLQGLLDSGRRHSVPSFVLSLFRAHCPGDFTGGHDISCSLCADIGPSSSLSPKPWICMFTVMLTGLLHRGAHWAFSSSNSGLSELLRSLPS